MLDYWAALTPYSLFNIHRKPDSPGIEISQFLIRRQSMHAVPVEQPYGTPAVILAPVPPGGKRFALPGERPPSMYGPNNPDTLIDRLDAWAVATGKVTRG